MTLCAIYRSSSTSVSTSSFLTNTVQYWKKEDKLEFFMRQNYIAAVHASRAGLSDLVGPSTIAYFDLTLAFETVPFVHTLFFLHCKYFHYHKYNFSLCSNFQCTLLFQNGDILWTMNCSGHFSQIG